MVALLIPNSFTPRRGRGSAGSLSEVKKGVVWACGADLRQWKCGGEFRGRRSVIIFSYTVSRIQIPLKISQRSVRSFLLRNSSNFLSPISTTDGPQTNDGASEGEDQNLHVRCNGKFPTHGKTQNDKLPLVHHMLSDK